MVWFALLLTALVAQLLPSAAAQENLWISPTPNDGDLTHIEGTFAEGSLIKLIWETNFTQVNLVIWQNNNSTLQYLPNSAPYSGTTYEWTVNLSGQGGNPAFDLKNGHTFFFEFFDAGATSGYESQYINITTSAAAVSTTSTSSSSTSSSTTSSSATQSATSTSASQTTTTTPATSPTNTAAPTSKDGLSKGAQAGIGVGVAIFGIAAIIGIIAFFTIRRRRAGETGGYPAPSGLPPTDTAKSYYDPPTALPQSMPKYAGRDPSGPMPELPETPAQNFSAVAGTHELQTSSRGY